MGYKFTDEDRQAIVDTATRLGISSAALTLVMGYESRGLNPDIIGGKENHYQGLIQFGPSQRAQYGYKPGMTIADQVRGPVYRYLADPKRGLKPGMGLAEIYSVINAGSLTKDGKPRWNASDGKLNIRQHVDRMLTQYMGKGSPADFTPPMNVGQTAQGKQMPLGMGRHQIKSGPAVSQLQQQLADAGLYKGKVDGLFGRQTAAAVRAAETTYGLNRDRGVAGPQVRAALAAAPVRDITSTFGINPPGGPAGPAVSSTDIGFGRAQAQMPWDVSPVATQSFQPGNPMNQGPFNKDVPMAPMSDPRMGLARGDPLRGDMTTRPIDPSLLVQDPMSGRGSPLYGGAPPVNSPMSRSFADVATAPPDSYTAGRAYAASHPPPTFFAGPGSGELSPPGDMPPAAPSGSPNSPSNSTGISGIPGAIFGPGGPIWNASEAVNGWIGGGSEPAAAAPSVSPAVPDNSYPGYIPGGFDYKRQDPMTTGSRGGYPQYAGGLSLESLPNLTSFDRNIDGPPIGPQDNISDWGRPANQSVSFPMGSPMGMTSNYGTGIPRDSSQSDYGSLPSRFDAPGYAPFPSGWKPGAYASNSAMDFGPAVLPAAGDQSAPPAPSDVSGLTFMPPSWSPQTDAVPAFFTPPPPVSIHGAPADQAKQALQTAATQAAATPFSPASSHTRSPSGGGSSSHAGGLVAPYTYPSAYGSSVWSPSGYTPGGTPYINNTGEWTVDQNGNRVNVGQYNMNGQTHQYTY